ncbi:MAG TPA: SDR family NAD(P)-dependent oxidoreductase, partial [Rhizomicrobium sp.]|nr:SDR family NAD(P)-dependent oxidoreductase [Rhizomicrobium sp.]
MAGHGNLGSLLLDGFCGAALDNKTLKSKRPQHRSIAKSIRVGRLPAGQLVLPLVLPQQAQKHFLKRAAGADTLDKTGPRTDKTGSRMSKAEPGDEAQMKWTIANIPSQRGKVAVVTGANSGIGWHTALELARSGGEVILTARSEEKGRDAVNRIRREVAQADVRAEILDLASLASVRRFAAKIGSEPKLDLLINNAGVMKVPKRELTEDGFERQFATNFLGHFALTGLLLPVLLRAPAPRVTTVSSVAATLELKRIDFKNIQGERGYHPWKAYCQSKLADLMFALELSRRCSAQGLRLLSNAAHPG